MPGEYTLITFVCLFIVGVDVDNNEMKMIQIRLMYAWLLNCFRL